MATFLVTKEIQARAKDGELALIRPGKVVSLESEKAETLIKAGKLKLVQSEPAEIEEYCNLCFEAIARINNAYYPRSVGWIDWLKECDPKLWEEIEEVERNLESPMDRGISLEQFSNLVNHWETLYRRAIESYLKNNSNIINNEKPNKQRSRTWNRKNEA